MAANSDNKPTQVNLLDRTKVYGLDAVAQHFGKHVRTFQRHAKDPGFPKPAQGRWYDLVQIELWLQQKKGLTGPPAEGSDDPDQDGEIPKEGSKKYWELREKKAQALRRELDYQERLGELVERKEVEVLFVARVMIVTQGLEALIRSLPPLLEGKEPRDMEQIIAQRIRALRELFARPLPEKFGTDKPEKESSGTDEGEN